MATARKILTGHVHRLVNGVLETAGPGDPAPDWVTNPDVIASAKDVATRDETPVNSPDTPAASNDETVNDESVNDETADDLEGKSKSDLVAVAVELGVAKTGSKAELIDRIRAKRETASGADEDVPHDRAGLIERAKELGIDVDDSVSEVELQALIEQKG